MSEKKKWVPPKDSWISLAPGASVFIDAEFAKKWNEQTRTFREVRGGFLAGCFEIERLLDSVLSEVFFPGSKQFDTKPGQTAAFTPQSTRAVKEMFDEFLLKGGSYSRMSFRTKIDLLKKLRARMQMLQDIVPEGLARRLDKIRDIRNRFAHYPVTFEPVGDPPHQDLSAELECPDKAVALDKAFFRKYSKLAESVSSELEAIHRGVKENPTRI